MASSSAWNGPRSEASSSQNVGCAEIGQPWVKICASCGFTDGVGTVTLVFLEGSSAKRNAIKCCRQEVLRKQRSFLRSPLSL